MNNPMNMAVKLKFDSYSKHVAQQLSETRQLIFTIAKQDGIDDLVETFKAVYGNTFQYDGNSAMAFKLDDVIPLKALAHGISISQRYKN